MLLVENADYIKTLEFKMILNLEKNHWTPLEVTGAKTTYSKNWKLKGKN